MSSNQRPRGFSTRAIHEGYDPLDYHGALNPPVFLTSTYAFDRSDTGSSRFAGTEAGYIYSRVGNPTVSVLETRLASLEDGEAALATSSGMGAITAVIWTLLKAGDEIVADQTLYGCTFALLHHQIARFGINTRFVDLTDPANLRDAITAKTRLVLTETPSNPNMRVVDIAATAEICRRAGVLLVVDNTYCTPYLQRPLALGADIVVHSATKYLGGHGDLLAGAVIASKELIDQFRFVGIKELNGACISAFDAFLVLRGLKTLTLRMDRHCESALRLAHDLEGHRAVERVYYPGLDSHPQHALARRQMSAFGGMIAIELAGGLDAGKAFMDAVRLVTRAVSLGDAETLVQHPASMTHSTYSPEERARHGFTDGLIRLSVGLEDYDDLRADLIEALDQVCD
ncbi:MULTISPECIES: methionine gamma-lyase [Rhodopseudomonas]|uniref:L-methionine gamma-lyase n=1 Tax=Rhodopseudomonas palustris TaxID=1076 RepID=A0A0D7EPD9_RHOPL|nr:MULTISPECIES: methionine gamma-lyase [Rhodopseudomonas]KIZ42415.1 methionine gamma-lyase [Rhodopseudomonas palustris]MDF3810270.1 methionine gamma-lyase [Rhodopseudomonas sp. BAL398]WOK16053.1 methionine gamma-lyase [Rhodopseudomonas sp. BAL398]